MKKMGMTSGTNGARSIMSKKNNSAELNGTLEKNEDGKRPDSLPAKQDPDASPLAIVGIGASAGGLEALEELLFLDSSMRVRRVAYAMKPIIRLIGNDIDMSITDLNANLLDKYLSMMCEKCSMPCSFKERQMETTDGKWFQMRIMPYRTSENRINGVAVR